MFCIHKQAVAQRFSAAAATYDQVAYLQRTVGNHLLEQIPTSLSANHVLDLGAGTGHFSQQLKLRFPSAQITAADLALGMLQHARQHQQADAYLCADMEHLPLASKSIDIIFSSLAVQWSLNFERTLTECNRVLRPGGLLVFSSVLEGSLIELKNSWAMVDNETHVNQFRTRQQYESMCTINHFSLVNLHEKTYCYYYDELRQLRHELRDLGVNHLHAGRRPHLGARARWQQLHSAYEKLRQPQGLPLSWKIIYLVLRKPC